MESLALRLVCTALKFRVNYHGHVVAVRPDASLGVQLFTGPTGFLLQSVPIDDHNRQICVFSNARKEIFSATPRATLYCSAGEQEVS